MHRICSFLICNAVLFSQLLMAEGIYQTEYVEPVEGATVECPLVSLQGTILRHTFPGIPNYESLENGDAPETRRVLVIPESEIQRLMEVGYIPQEDIFTS